MCFTGINTPESEGSGSAGERHGGELASGKYPQRREDRGIGEEVRAGDGWRGDVQRVSMPQYAA